jgi:hypothetical protein
MEASLGQILSRRAIRKRPKVVNQMGLIEVAARESNICPIHLRFASQQIKDLLQASNTTKQFWSQPHLIAEESIEMARTESNSIGHGANGWDRRSRSVTDCNSAKLTQSKINHCMSFERLRDRRNLSDANQFVDHPLDQLCLYNTTTYYKIQASGISAE